MAARTPADVYSEIRYELTPHAGAYASIGSNSKVSKPLGECLTLIARINRGQSGEDVGLTAEETEKLINIFPKEAPASLGRVLSDFNSRVIPLLNELLTLKNVAAISMSAATVDAHELHKLLRLDIPSLWGGNHMATFAKLQQHFPKEGGWLTKVGNNKAKLSLEQVILLLALPEKISNHNDFQTPSPEPFLKDYAVLVPTLTQLQAALLTSVPVEERVAADQLEQFWQKHGQPLQDVYDKYKGRMWPHISIGLDSLLQAGKSLNQGSALQRYTFNRLEFHKLLTEAAALPVSGDHKSYGPLANGMRLLADARDQIYSSGANSDFRILSDAHSLYSSNINHKVGFAKEAVARLVTSLTP